MKDHAGTENPAGARIAGAKIAGAKIAGAKTRGIKVRGIKLISIKGREMLLAALSFVTMASLLWIGPNCLAQTLTIRVVDTNGHPAGKQKITLSLSFAGKTPREHFSNGHLKDVHFETNKNGEARYQLPNPPPTTVLVIAGLDWRHWDCSCSVSVSPQDLIQNGKVFSGTKVKTYSPSIKASPWEIVFVARRVSLIVQLITRILK